MTEKKIKIFAPESHKILFIQILSMAPFVTAIDVLVMVATTTPKTPSTFGDYLILFLVFIFPLFLLSIIMLYLPQRYKAFILFYEESNTVHKIKNKSVQVFDISKAKFIVSRTIKQNLYYRYYLIIEDVDNNLEVLFDEKMPYSPRHWNIFAEKLSKTIGVPIKIEKGGAKWGTEP